MRKKKNQFYFSSRATLLGLVMSAGFDKNGKPIIDVSDLQAKIKEYGDKVKALKAEKKPKDDPELVAAINALNKAKEELAEVTKPVETNPFAKCRAELEDITKRRFFYRPAFDIYGGTAGFYTYGPPGSALKANIQALWRKHFIIEENLMEIEDPTITPYDVLKTSGHVDRFNDFMVKDSKDDSKFFRADKLLEEELENRLKVPTCSDAERTKYKQDMLAADSFTREQLHAKLQEYGVKAPESGNDLTEPYAFNLMFPTPIGPSGLLQGYLRPETAQGIFLNYKYCAEQNAEKMPFGVAQIGKSYRNEIAPRGGLVRQREFTQAEIEFFCRPKNKDFEKFVATGLDKL
jgi:glycyl-tRNA synthetase